MTKITVPIAIDDSRFVSSNLTEANGEVAWAVGTTYSLGDYVYHTDHHLYRSSVGSNLGNDPETDGGVNWTDYGWVNRWRALKTDTADLTIAEGSGGIFYEISSATTCTEVVLMGVKGASVTVEVKDATTATVSSETKTGTETVNAVAWHISTFIFTGLSIASGYTIEVTVADPATGVAQIGQVVIGYTHTLGTMLDGAQVGIEDFSVRSQNSYGEFTVTERGYARFIDVELQHETARLAWVMSLLIDTRVSPSVFWADATLVDAGLCVLGVADDPVTPPSVTWSNTSLRVTGLSFESGGEA